MDARYGVAYCELLVKFFVSEFRPFLTYVFRLELARSVARPEVVRGDQTLAFKLFQFILSYGIFVFLMHGYFAHCNKLSYLH